MGSAQATWTLPVALAEAERRWYDTAGWADWVEGLDEVVEVEPGWPEVGASVTWVSGPAGRGRVTERAVEYEPGAGQTVEVHDDSITGRQSVAFAPAAGGVEVRLRLEYHIRAGRAGSLITPLVDLLFVRRSMTASLRQTLERFAARAGRS
ncbi:MAG: SRPBCC family protein [Solirubrobacteraceae bacterium]